MSLDKGIEHGKEWRRPYYGSAAFDRSCRPGGDCPWCYGNRMHSTRVRLLKGCSLDDEIEEPPKAGNAGEKSPAFLCSRREKRQFFFIGAEQLAARLRIHLGHLFVQ